MKNGLTLQVLARSCGNGKAEVKVGTLSPKQVFAVGVYEGDTSSTRSLEEVLRRAEKIAGRRARKILAQTPSVPV